MLATLYQEHIDYDMFVNVFAQLIESDNEAQIAAALALLNKRPEKVDMLTAAVKVMQTHMQTYPLTQPAIDIVGTGGDGHNTINISTATAIALAATGIVVAKHGNRSVSSRCGSADVLETLGFDLTDPQIDTHFIFCFAPQFHPALKKFSAIRKALAYPTIFNLLGPLLNPATPSHAIIGVNKAELLPIYSKVCQRLAFKRVLLVHTDGTDELSCHGTPQTIEIHAGNIKANRVDPVSIGLSTHTLQDLRGGDANTNARVLQTIFKGEDHPAKNTIALNIAAGLYLMDKYASMHEAAVAAKALLQSGQVYAYLRQLLDN